MKKIIVLITLTLNILTSTYSQEDKTETAFIEAKTSSGEIVTFPLKAVTANVQITGFIAHVTSEQTYINHTDGIVHATYVFPGSTQAAVHGMTMKIEDRVIEAKIEVKEKAIEKFEEAKTEGKSASLLQQHRPNVFQMDIGNIQPNVPLKITLKYTEVLKPREGIYEFVYPTIVGERYNQEVSSGESWTLNPYANMDQDNEVDFNLPQFDIKVKVDSPIPLKGLNVSSHKSMISYSNEKSAIVKLNNGGLTENKDFILRYRLQGDTIETGITLFEGEDENFFLYIGQAQKQREKANTVPREYFFIVDVSGSMNGFPLSISKNVIRNILSSIGPENKFNVLLFAASSEVFSEISVTASPSNISNALQFIDRVEGGGGTNLLNALKHAFRMIDQKSSTSMVILTDGFVTVEKRAFEFIDQNLDQANFFPLGIGSSVNRYIIEGIAHFGHSEPFIITKPEQANSFGSRFIDYVSNPVLANAKLEFEGLKTYDVLPAKIPDLFTEKPIVVYGKWEGKPKGKVLLTGRSGNEDYALSTKIKKSDISENSHELRYLWARKKLQLLSDYNYTSREKEFKESITQIGLKYSLLSEYTSFVAIDEENQKVEQEDKFTANPGAVPEPHEWALIIVGMLLISWFYFKHV